MRHLLLTENSPARPFDLTREEAEALANLELASVSRAPGASSWEVAAGSKVGVVRLGELQVTVRPKIAMDRLIFLMGYARNPKHWRDHSVLLDAEADLVEALVESFAGLARRALEQGLLHGYRLIEDALPVVRGRIRVGDQMSRRFGRGLPVEVAYDDFTTDTAENQLLLAATLVLLRLPVVSPQTRKVLLRLRMQLSDVSVPPRGLLPPWQPSRLNTRYQPALRLADLILAGASFEQRIGDLEVSGFVLDMWKLYEDFVCVALEEAMAPYGGGARLQHRMHLDEAREVDMRPDFLWRRNDRAPIVVDAKYKAEKPSGFPQADLYQMLAYCTVLGASEGHLIYAAGNEVQAVHEIVGANVKVRIHTLDLAQPPSALLDQISELCAWLQETPDR